MIVRVAIDLALDRLFTYEVPEALERKLAVGQLLSVPFGRQRKRAFAMEIADAADTGASYRIKPVDGIIDEQPFFSAKLLELARMVAEYTASPIESVLKAAVPAAVVRPDVKPREMLFVEPALAPFEVEMTKRQQWLYDQIARLGGGWMGQLCRELKTTPASIRVLGGKGLVKVAARTRRRNPLAGRRIIPSRPLELNEEQEKALETIAGADRPVLLRGVTGSGKTEVYLQAIARVLEEGRGAIVMVPEIALTPQTVQRFASRFGDRVAVLHSALSDGERYDEWHRIRSGRAQVAVGPRSAVFAPVRNLGLIVVDEEHDTSYKQNESPRYNARDVAVLRGRLEGAKVVLGSATPSLESWLNAKKGKYLLSSIDRRAGAGTMPAVRLVDMTGNRGIYSKELLDAIRRRLERAEQTILFLNRRGYSRSTVCENCGGVVTCPDCSVPYTYHRADDCLRCHICGGWIPVPSECPECRAGRFSYRGTGTQRAEAALKKCFPAARILRMDADSTSRRHSHDDILSAFGRGDADILVGTQMIAKGLDFKNVTLVGVLNANSSLDMPDFRAAERTYQLLAQVSGRAGRAELPGEVVIQCFDPDATAIKLAARGAYRDFADGELKIREECWFPPYCHLAVLNLKSKDLDLVSKWSDMYAKSLAKINGLAVSEAVPCALEKAEGWYRWQIVVRSASAAAIVNAYRWLSGKRQPVPALRVCLDMDAISVN
ncbi:MAG: primosomal protein N' [Kiritimatiellae bacterium]|nr:primosomal protein N' [Kiritimatiellia bacterium]